VLNVTEFKLKSQQKTSKTKDSGLKASRKTLSNHLTIIKIKKDTQQFQRIADGVSSDDN
jgi:DNA-binding CsgD family transcriptional regulator